MPDFTQWNVPSPFPNVLYNPAAVDAAIAKTQSELGNLDINQQELQLKKDEFARGQSFADTWNKSIDGATGTTGAAAGGGGGSFLSALAQVESGDKNIVSGTDKDNQGLTLAQGGNPAEISQGHFQIQTATWRDFAKQAGVDVNQYPNAMSAPREIQARVASVIPFSRFGPRTQTLMRQQFGDIDSSRTVGDLAGLGPRVAPAARAAAPPVVVAAPVAPPIVNPNAGPRVANLPGGVIGEAPPAAVASPAGPTITPPTAPGSAEMEAVKKASVALLAMPEAEAALAYGPTVAALQAQGLAMKAPPEYPGHAALQAIVGGGQAAEAVPVAPSRIALRTGGTDTAGPAAGQTTLPPVEQPNRMYQTGLAGVTIAAPGNALAPPPVVTAAAPATPAAAPPGATRPPLEAPPAAPTRVIPREPLIQSGPAAGLTRTQAVTIGQMLSQGAKPAVVMQHADEMRHQNDVIRQGDATQAAIEQQANYERQEAYRKARIEVEKTQYERGRQGESDRRAAEDLKIKQAADARDAERLRLAQEAARQQGLPTGWRLGEDGKTAYRVEGLPPDPKPPEPKPLPETERKNLLDAGAKLDQVVTSLNTFKPEYGGFGSQWYGDFRNMMARASGESPRADWWQEYQRYKLAVRQGISGQSLTASELGEFDKADINPGMAPSTIAANLRHQQALIEQVHNRRIKSLEADGYNAGAISAAGGDRPAPGSSAAPTMKPPPKGSKVIIP